MNNSTLAITYAGASVPDDGYWMRLSQDAVDTDVATVADAANLLDALFSLAPCSEEEGGAFDLRIAEITSGEALIGSLLQEAAAEAEVDTVICGQEADGSVEVNIKIITSHPFDPHRLRITGGELVVETLEQADISKTITLQAAESVVLDFPVVSWGAASWAYTADGSMPAIKRNGNTLYWQGPITGSLRVAYKSAYYLATIKVLGVDGKQGESTVRCFFHGLVEEKTPNMPEAAETDDSLCTPTIRGELSESEDTVTCYQSVVVHKRCSCSKEEIDFDIYDEVVPCPDWAPKKCPGALTTCMNSLGTVSVDEFVKCTNDGDNNLQDPDYYESVCCHAPGNLSLPDCREEHRTWKGGVPVEHGLDYWKGIYGDKFKLVQVKPDGGICGEWTIRQEIGEDCCTSVTPPVYNWASSVQVIGDSSSGVVFWSASRGPYTVEVSGTGFYLDPGRTKKKTTVNGTSATVYANGLACGTGNVNITDFCGNSVLGQVRSSNGQWVVGTDLAGACSLPIDHSGYIPASTGARYSISGCGSYAYPGCYVGGFKFDGCLTGDSESHSTSCSWLNADLCTTDALGCEQGNTLFTASLLNRGTWDCTEVPLHYLYKNSQYEYWTETTCNDALMCKRLANITRYLGTTTCYQAYVSFARSTQKIYKAWEWTC